MPAWKIRGFSGILLPTTRKTRRPTPSAKPFRCVLFLECNGHIIILLAGLILVKPVDSTRGYHIINLSAAVRYLHSD
jgi:hypothetical protein